MEVICLSSGRVSSLSCCPSSSNFTAILPSSASSATSSVLVASTSSLLPIKLERSTSSSNVYRSSIWSATPLDYGSSFGVLRLLPRQTELVETRRDGSARAYLERKNPVFNFLNKVQGSIPVVGLVARLLNPEGGVGTDRIRFEEFCTRVGRNSTIQDSSAFYKLAAKYGKTAKAPFVLIWCWAAALGAGLLRSEDLRMGAQRLRCSFDLQYEVENFDLLMDEATKKREKTGSKVPDVPMESRAEKALEAMIICCTGRKDIAEEDAPLFSTILKVVFPTADKEEIDYMVGSRVFDPFAPTVSDSDESQELDDGEIDAVEEPLASAEEQPQRLVQELLL